MKKNKLSMNNTSRRQFLKGCGVTLSLPLLETFSSKAFAVCSESQRPRFIAIYIPNGVVVDDWFSLHPGGGNDAVDAFANWQDTAGPSQSSTIQTASEWTTARSMQHITDIGLKSKIALYNHLSNQDLANGGYDGGEHPVGTTAFLNCAGQRIGDGTPRSEISIDQVIANHYAAQATPSPFHSMHLTSGVANYWHDGVAQEYSENISWQADGSPVNKYLSPLLAFERYIAAAPGEASESAKKRSILDYVLQDAQQLTTKLSQNDRERLDDYLTSVRALELNIQSSNNGTCTSNGKVYPHISSNDIDYASYDRSEHMRLHYEIMALAARCQLTDVMTYVVDHERSEYNYGPGAGDHHGAQHGSSSGVSNILDILVPEFARFLQSLNGITDPNGQSALDNSVVMFGSGLSGRFRNQRGEDITHQRKIMPLVFAGSGGGVLKTDQQVALPFGTKLSNCFNTLLQEVYCVPGDPFAHSDSIISEMLI